MSRPRTCSPLPRRSPPTTWWRCPTPTDNFAAQNVLPLVYKKGVTPAVINALDGVSAKLTTAGLLAMNKQAIINHANYATVAAAWLRQQDLS